MAESKPFETAVKTVNSKLAKTKHLHLKTKKIIEEGNLETALANIQKKNFTLTSANHLAAILIKIIEIYVNEKVVDDKRAATFIKYINLLQKGILDLFTVKKILTKLSLQKLYTLIEKKYGSISDEAKTILKGVNFNEIDLGRQVMEKFDTTNKQIAAAEGGLLTSLEFKTLLDVFETIKSVCKESFGDNKFLKSKLTNSLPIVFRIDPKTIDKTNLSTLQKNLFNEFAYLYHVIHQKYGQADTILKECHKDAVRKLLTAQRRIKQAYEKLPPKPSYSPPPVPTDDIPDYPPPLGSVTPNNTPTATTEQKTPSTLPRPGRPAPKSSDFYNQRAKLKTANGEHTPPADPLSKPPRRANSKATPTATTEQKTPSTLPRPDRPAPKSSAFYSQRAKLKTANGEHTPPADPPPPAPKGKSGTAKTPRQQYKRDLETQRKKGLPTTPPELTVPTTNDPPK